MSKNTCVLQHGKLPQISGAKALKIFCNNFGCEIINNVGSHYTLLRKKHYPPIVFQVPLHKELKRGTLSHILTAADISRNEFLESITKRQKEHRNMPSGGNEYWPQ
jgi:predicted RNA binding protein YcfA (HicA-like mRNA interferase family)